MNSNILAQIAKRSLAAALFMTIAGTGLAQFGAMPAADAAKTPDYVPNQLIIKFRNAVSDADQAAFLAKLQARKIDNLDYIKAVVVSVPSSRPLDEWRKIAKGSQLVKYAEPNFTLKLQASSPATTANDTYFSRQWALNNSGADAGVAQAWGNYKPTGTVIVAVIDTGVDYNHADLSQNIYVNAKEDVDKDGKFTKKDQDLKDTDKNGYVDDLVGWNFSAGNANSMDDNGHGTHVSGIIAAVPNNKYGVAGVAGQGRVVIMPLKFLDKNGSGSTSNAVKALDYATRNGARIVNASWGGGSFNQPLYDAINQFKGQSGLFITAAGNNGSNNDSKPTYPANYKLDNIIAVASIDSNDKLSSFSNYGSSTVHVAAPGGSIISTYPGNQFAQMSGTSMATPYVAGVAALVLSQRPSLKGSELKNILMSSVRSNNNLTGKVYTAGVINAAKALSR